jgi:hypothetical protein
MSISHIQICYQLLQTHPPTHTSTPSLVRRRRRRIVLPCFANANPLPEAGNNNYLGSECDYLPEAGNNIYWYPSYANAHTSAYSLWAVCTCVYVCVVCRYDP